DSYSFNRKADSAFRWLSVQSRSVVESAMLMLHSGRPYGTDSSRQRQDHARRPSCYTAIEGFDPRVRQPLRNPKTVMKWRKRAFLYDAPMGPKVSRSTVLSAAYVTSY